VRVCNLIVWPSFRVQCSTSSLRVVRSSWRSPSVSWRILRRDRRGCRFPAVGVWRNNHCRSRYRQWASTVRSAVLTGPRQAFPVSLTQHVPPSTYPYAMLPARKRKRQNFSSSIDRNISFPATLIGFRTFLGKQLVAKRRTRHSGRNWRSLATSARSLLTLSLLTSSSWLTSFRARRV